MTRIVPAARLAAVVALFALGVVGCGDGSPATGKVVGEVTLDGQPLKTGMIRFVAVDGKTAADAPVTDGKFTATVPVGAMKVEVTASKVIGKKKMYDTPDSPVVEETASLIPDRYNVKTELTFDVKSGEQSAKFAVTSK